MNVVEHLLAGIVPHRYTARETLVDSDSLMSLFLQSGLGSLLPFAKQIETTGIKMKRVNYGPAFDQNHLAKESHDRTLALAGSRVLPPMSGRAFGYTGGVVHNMNIKHNMHYSGKSYSEEAEIYDAIHGTDIARSAPALA
jgi:hypothetical protein